MSASGTAQQQNQPTSSASRQTVAQLVAQLDPGAEVYRQTAGITDRGEFADRAGGENSSVCHEKTETTRVGDNQAKETRLKGSEGLNGQDTAGHDKRGGLYALEKQLPGSPLQIQVGPSNLWQQPSKVSRSPSRRWSFSRRRESRRASRVRDSRGSPSEATAKREISDTLVDQQSTVAGRDGSKAQAQRTSSLPPRPSSGEFLGQPAGENAHPHQNLGLPPRPVSWGTATKATGADESRSPLDRVEKQSEVSSSSQPWSSRVEGSTKLSAAASSAAATAAAVLKGDLRTKSESAVSADVRFSCHEKRGMTQDSPASSQPSQATALTAPVATAGEVVSGGDRRSTPVRGRSLFSSGRESRAQRKGSGFIHYFKGPLRSTGADRSSTTIATVPKEEPPAHAPTRDRTPSSTPGTSRKASASFSNPGKWRPRSIPMRRSRDKSIRRGALEGEGQIQTTGVSSGISGMTSVFGSERTVIPAVGVGDSGQADNDGTNNSRNLNVGIIRPESAAVVSAGGGGKGSATEEENRDDDPSVAPEDGQEDVHGMEEKEEIVEVEEQLEGDGEEPEAVISESCSFTGLLECGRSLKVEGKFAGELVSTGSVTIGPTGTVTGDLDNIKFLLVDGQLTGNVMCNTVVIGKVGKVFGNITSESITMGPQGTMRGMLNIVEDISQARAEGRSLKLQTGNGTLGMDSVAGNVEARSVETPNKEENVEGLESGVIPGRAGAEQAAAVEADAELKAKAGPTDAEHETKPASAESGDGCDQKPQNSSSLSDVADDDGGDVLQFEGPPTGEGDAGDLDKFDAAAVARAAEAEAKAAEAEAKVAATEAMMARADARAAEAEVPSSSDNPG